MSHPRGTTIAFFSSTRGGSSLGGGNKGIQSRAGRADLIADFKCFCLLNWGESGPLPMGPDEARNGRTTNELWAVGDQMTLFSTKRK